MAKKQQSATKKLTARLPLDLWKRLRYKSTDTQVSMEALVIAALEAFLRGAKP
jgi:hypothetical protein